MNPFEGITQEAADELHKQGLITPEQHGQMTGKLASLYNATPAAPTTPPAVITPEQSANAGPIDVEAFKTALQPQTPAAVPVAEVVTPIDETVPPAGFKPVTTNIPQQAPASRAPSLTNVQQSTTTSKSTGASYDPAAVKAMDNVQTRMMDLEDSKIRLAEAQGQQLEAKAKADALAYNQFVEQEAKKKADVALEVSRRQNEIDKLQSEYQTAKIDGNRLFADMSTGNKILAGVALALGTLGAAKDGNNVAVDIIEKAIDRDIDVQKSNLAKQGQSLQGARGAYKDFLDRTGDEDLARLATFNLGLQAAARQFDAIGASNATEAKKIEAQNGKALIEEKIAANKLEMSKRITDKTVETIDKAVDTTPKALPDLPTDFKKDIANADKSVMVFDKLESAMKEFESLDEKSNPNAVQLAANNFLKKFGLDDAEISDLEGLSNEILASKIKEFSGVAASEKEVERIRKMLPLITQNPKAFYGQLNRARSEAIDNAEYTRKQWEGVHSGIPNRIYDPNKYKNVGFKASN